MFGDVKLFSHFCGFSSLNLKMTQYSERIVGMTGVFISIGMYLYRRNSWVCQVTERKSFTPVKKVPKRWRTMPVVGLTIWLSVWVNDSHPMRRLSRGVHHLRTAVAELVSFQNSHLGPVGVVDRALKQANSKGVWDDGASVHHCFSGREQAV